MFKKLQGKSAIAFLFTAILAMASLTFTAAPAQADPAPSFTVTDNATSQTLTDLVGTEGQAIDNTYTITFDNSTNPWVFGTPGMGYGWSVGGLADGLDYHMTLGSANGAQIFTFEIFGTPTTGFFKDSSIMLQDDYSQTYTYHFNSKIDAITPTNYTSVDGPNHITGDVQNLPNTHDLFATDGQPTLWLEPNPGDALISLAPTPGDTQIQTTVKDGVSTTTYTTGTLYSDQTYGSIVATVTITATDGEVTYKADTWSMDWEGAPVDGGNLYLKAALNVPGGFESQTGMDGSLMVKDSNDSAPFTHWGGMPTSTTTIDQAGNLTVIAGPHDDGSGTHIAHYKYFDYSDCPTFSDLVDQESALTLSVTGYTGPGCTVTPFFTATPTSGYAGDTVNIAADANTWMLIGHTQAIFTRTGQTDTQVDVSVDATWHAGTLVVPTLPEVGDYTVNIMTTGNFVNSFVYHYLGANVPPTITGDLTDLGPGQTLHITVTGDPADYVLCDYVDGVRFDSGCVTLAGLPSLDYPWELLSTVPGIPGHTLTFRVFPASQIVNSAVPAWSESYTSTFSWYVQPLAPTVPGPVSNLQVVAHTYSSLQFTWDAPTTDGGSPLTHYYVYVDGQLYDMANSDANSGYYGVYGFAPHTTHHLVITAKNAVGESSEYAYDFTTDSIGVTVDPVAEGTAGVEYSQTINANPSGWAYYQVLGTVYNQVPDGLAFVEHCSEGCYQSLDGTPTTAGTYVIHVTYSLQGGYTAETDFTVVIHAAAVTPSGTPVFKFTSLGDGVVGTAFTGDASATSVGSTGITYAVTAGTLPAGLALDPATGAITGTPTVAAAYDFTVTATTNDSVIAAQRYTGSIAVETVVFKNKTIAGKSVSIKFLPDSAKLTKKAQGILKALVSQAKGKGLTRIQVVAFTHKWTSKNPGWRAALGKARAIAVVKYLRSIYAGAVVTGNGKGLINKGRIATITLAGKTIKVTQ
jgi:outer membrane protein OmpA-like peptidoglycan-associated protein